MTVAAARWSAYNTWAQLRADRAQLLADLASHASPQLIAADRASLAASQQQLATHHATRLDITI